MVGTAHVILARETLRLARGSSADPAAKSDISRCIYNRRWITKMLDLAKGALVLAMLFAFAAIGIGCTFNPDWGMRHFARSLMAVSYGRIGTGCRCRSAA
jgi:hypothetical protein